MESTTTLGEAIHNNENLPWNESLFLPDSHEWSLTSPCIIWDGDDLEPGEEVPEIAKKHSMIYVMTVSTFQDIIKNAKLQKKDCTPSEVLLAFNYYLDNDAFITSL